MQWKSVLLGGSQAESVAGNLGLLLLRAFTGLSMALAHGLPKFGKADGFIEGVAELGFPAPGFFGWAAILSEFVGGLLLALGLGTRVAAGMILITMLVAALMSHGTDPFSQQEKAWLYGLLALMFLLKGAGRYSVDALIQPR
jgi:putative oxidoreductase